MEILYVTKKSKNLMDQWVYWQFIDELRDNKIKVNVVNYSDFNNSLDNFYLFVEKEIKKKKYTLFMTDLIDRYMDETILKLANTYGLPKLCICWDSILLPNEHKKYIKHFDLVWIFSEKNKNIYLRNGAKKVIVQPYACNPSFSKKSSLINLFPLDGTHGDIVFIGSPYGSRSNIINTITGNELCIDVYNSQTKDYKKKKRERVRDLMFGLFAYSKSGDGLKIIYSSIKNQFNKNKLIKNAFLKELEPIENHKLPLIYSQYKLCLAFSSARNTDILKQNVPIINLRSFEIGMSGGAQIIRKNNELKNYFTDGKEIIFYDGRDELIDKIKFYSACRNKTKLDRIKRNAQQRSLKEHKWIDRFSNIFDAI